MYIPKVILTELPVATKLIRLTIENDKTTGTQISVGFRFS